MNAVCALLLLFVEEAEAVAELWLRPWLRLKLWLMLMLHSAQKQGKRGEGVYMQQEPHKGANVNGEREGGLLELHAQAPHGFITASPLAFASCFLC